MSDHSHAGDSHRPSSLRSVASNSSIASGASLTRRARTRVRSKTLTGSARPNQPPKGDTPEPLQLDMPYAQERPVPGLFQLPGPQGFLSSQLQAAETVEAYDKDTRATEDVERALGTSFVTEHSMPSVVAVALPKTVRQASNRTEISTLSNPQPPPSAFSRDPSLTRINMAAANVRDSVSTQQSRASSSLYPPSTSTVSAPDSPPSPSSMIEQDENYDVSSFDPDVGKLQEYDGDDVAYRLRLLVNNNYFLPPAHSKPSPSDFALSAQASKKPARATTPTFRDLFRVGKSKSKPTTPTGSSQPFDPTPALRTTSDSIAASYALRPQPRLSSQMPRTSTHPDRPRDRSGRVVVVREKMSDLAVAAKKAEHDMKARGVSRDHGPQQELQDILDELIDPTDTVDLPPPSSSYPFAVQASALHGLGVQDSVGAAALADRLPPPNSPGMSSSYDTEDDWRMALLQQAVHHSLDNSPDVSSFSVMLGASSTPLGVSRRRHTESTSQEQSPSNQQVLERRIISHPRISDTSTRQVSRKKSSHSHLSTSTSKGHTSKSLVRPTISLDISRPPSYFPLRADTPSGPLTPLTPPPRRHFVNPPYSVSQTELPRPNLHEQSSSSGGPTPPSLRKTVSSPMLMDGYRPDSHYSMMTPPHLAMPALSSQSSLGDLGASSFDTSRGRPVIASSEFHYSDDELLNGGDMPRSSIALSVLNSPPSLSDCSQLSLSPTASAFQDTLNAGGRPSTSLSSRQPARSSIDQQATRDSPIPRNSTMSPPPRMSSSLAHIALSPPPRSSSFQYRPISSAISTSIPLSEPDHPSPLTDDTTLHIVAPEPTTPPVPISKGRGNPANTQLSPDIPNTKVPAAIHSVPGPSSPTSFFDSIQTQPNAMDDLDSSSGESEDDRETIHDDDRGPTDLFVDPRTHAISSAPAADQRPPIMRFGNHSSPYMARPAENRRTLLPFGAQDPKKPIGYVPTRAPFFTERSGKSDQGHGPPMSTLDFYKYTQQHPPPSTGPSSTLGPKRPKPRSAPSDSVANWQSTQRAKESLRRLDGMLVQHMETEKDTIKRIATTARSTAPSTPNT